MKIRIATTVWTVRRRFSQYVANYKAGEEVEVSASAKTLQGIKASLRTKSPSSAGEPIFRAGLPSPAECKCLVDAFPSDRPYGIGSNYQGLVNYFTIKSKPDSMDTYPLGSGIELGLRYHDYFQPIGNLRLELQETEGN